MTDELISTEVEESPSAEDVKTEKKYSDKDVQKMISERLKREKSISSQEKENFTQRESDYLSQIKGYEEAIEKLLNPQLEGMPEPYKKLLDKLTVLEKLEWLSDPKNNVSKRTVTETPKGENKQKSPDRTIQKFI